jgi:hypothetical protein
MRRWLWGGAVAGLLLVFVALPIGVGFSLEQGFPSLLDRVRDQLGPGYVVRGQLDRGLLSSISETVLEPVGDGAGEGPIVLQHRWAHGPFPLSELLAGRMPIPPVLVLIRNAPSMAGLAGTGLWGLDTELRLNFDGSLAIELAAPAFESDALGFASEGWLADVLVQGGVRGARGSADLGPMRMQGARGRVEIEASTLRFHAIHSPAGSQIDGTFDLGGGQGEWSGGGDYRFDPSTGTFRARRAPNELDASFLDLALAQAEFAVPGSSVPGVIRGAHMRLDVKSEPGMLVRADAVISLDALEWERGQLGAVLARITLSGVDISAAADFRRALAELEAAAESEAIAAEAQADLIVEWLPALASASPEFRLDRLEWEWAGGKGEAAGWIRIDGSNPAAFAQEAAAMEALEARGSLTLPVSLVHQGLDAFLAGTVEAQAGPLPSDEIAAMTEFLREMAVMRLLETGVLLAEGDHYLVEFRFEQGVTIVNGKLIGPGGLMALLTGAG